MLWCWGALFKNNEKKGRRYKREELIEAGLITDFESVCKKCHNPESPVIDPDYEFETEHRFPKVHIPVKLKYHRREE